MNKFLKFAAAGSLVLGLTSCLKDKGFDDNTTGHDLSDAPKVVELAYANEVGHSKAYAFDFEDVAITQTVVNIRLAAAAPAGTAVTVKLDTTGAYARLQAFNPDVVLLPTSFYTMDNANLTYTIAAGQVEVPVRINTNAIQFDPSTTYGLFFKLSSVDQSGYNLSGNYDYYIATFGAKNKYDGIYSMNSFHNRPGYQLLLTDEEMHMITVGGSEVAYYWPAVPSFGHPIMSPTGLSWYGATVAPNIIFDPSTDLITSIYNTAIAAGGPPIDIMTGAGAGVGRYDAATKTIYAYFRYNANDARGFLDTLVYTGPR